MIDPITRRRLSYRTLFVVIGLVLIFVRLMPVDHSPGGLPGPDLTLALTLAWVLRRPEYAPALLIVLVFLLEDIMFWRPIGLWALIVLGATEFLRRREQSLRDLPFALEWALVAGLLIAMVAVKRIVLLVTMVDQPSLGLELFQMLVTLAAYPVVVLVSRVAFGLRRAAPGEVDAYGHRM
ncbi:MULTISPECIES: rod shape-determining protein MreD [Thioclava]|uniref:Rod shape-determining protein MreD n=1 Tax=Thioclava electrotropha TaxID=1549850 RepID=A0ABX6YW79_9RHOB|nr:MULTISPECIES: rod shape-determining protein MreD [Thioclava]MAQ36977.1 rod shape-determining protein MreD [Thioclava sp.]MPQ93142.1 rod shape-determining protein MreD [Thioclava sp. JE_KL1]OOY05688.1 rod shape-determining protein MreD [Thioclava sp. F28-4]OOY10123.1 rod shape-determining protein MreD [Thioclava sp. F36-7]OOY16548.1 rod shape-determining protein MreD [Thioclava sp. DLFJ4-1]